MQLTDHHLIAAAFQLVFGTMLIYSGILNGQDAWCPRVTWLFYFQALAQSKALLDSLLALWSQSLSRVYRAVCALPLHDPDTLLLLRVLSCSGAAPFILTIYAVMAAFDVSLKRQELMVLSGFCCIPPSSLPVPASDKNSDATTTILHHKDNMNSWWAVPAQTVCFCSHHFHYALVVSACFLPFIQYWLLLDTLPYRPDSWFLSDWVLCLTDWVPCHYV